MSFLQAKKQQDAAGFAFWLIYKVQVLSALFLGDYGYGALPNLLLQEVTANSDPTIAELVKAHTVDSHPDLLIIQLSRFKDDGSKSDTVFCLSNILPLRDVNNVQAEYPLRAVTSHIGQSANSGHYIAFVPDNRVWLQMNDSRTPEIINSWDQIQVCGLYEHP